MQKQKTTLWSNWGWPWSRQSCFTSIQTTILYCFYKQVCLVSIVTLSSGDWLDVKIVEVLLSFLYSVWIHQVRNNGQFQIKSLSSKQKMYNIGIQDPGHSFWSKLWINQIAVTLSNNNWFKPCSFMETWENSIYMMLTCLILMRKSYIGLSKRPHCCFLNLLC